MSLDFQVVLLVGPVQDAEWLSSLMDGLMRDSIVRVIHLESLSEVQEPLERILPDLILLFADTLEQAGEDVQGFCQHLRERHPKLGPVLVVQTREGEEKRIEYLMNGADDILPEGLGLEELRVRLLVHLRRNLNAHTNNVTMLPELVVCEKIWFRREYREEAWALMLVEIDYFNTYMEVYGHIPGDQVLRTFAALLSGVVRLPDFVSQTESNEFLILTHPDKVDKLAAILCRQFDTAAPNFYSEKDRKQGYMISVEEEGSSRRTPLLSLSIGTVSSQVRSFPSFLSAYHAANEMKDLAKRVPGSYWMSERHRLAGDQTTRGVESSFILVVESDAALAFLLKTTLEMHGYQVITVSSRKDALDVLAHQTIHLVVLDSLLHGEPEGLELCRQIREGFPELPILCTSTLHQRDQVLRAGADIYLPKPFELISLFTWIDRLLKGR